MTHGDGGRIAILYPGDYEGRRNATAENNRFAELFRAFIAKGIYAEPAVYRDDFCEEVREQLMQEHGARRACDLIEQVLGVENKAGELAYASRN